MLQGPEFRWGNSGLWARLRGHAPCMTANEGLAEACTGQKGKRAGERGAAPGPLVEATCTAWPWGAALSSCCCTHHPHPWGQNSAAAPGPGAGPCPGSAVASLGLCQGRRESEPASTQAVPWDALTVALNQETLPSCTRASLKGKTDLEWGGGVTYF